MNLIMEKDIRTTSIVSVNSAILYLDWLDKPVLGETNQINHVELYMAMVENSRLRKLKAEKQTLTTCLKSLWATLELFIGAVKRDRQELSLKTMFVNPSQGRGGPLASLLVSYPMETSSQTISPPTEIKLPEPKLLMFPDTITGNEPPKRKRRTVAKQTQLKLVS